MEFLLDTIHIADIEKYAKIISLAGVTSNPTIVKKEGKANFFDHMRQIRSIIGRDKSLHVQAVGQTTDVIVKDAFAIVSNIDEDVFVKVPTNEAGLAAIKILKQNDVHVTATAIYSEFQGRLAIEAGSDYLAPYYNRMINMGIDAKQVIKHLAYQIALQHAPTKILAASFHTVGQVNDAFQAGAQAATMGVDILRSALQNPAISNAVLDFTKDWESVYGVGTNIATLADKVLDH
ncbi:fructose-6-phosphate aldolase [Lacticaseibacillus parahuelsenbergensis]|uniref:Fructose-6-phosphate aldolase n=1 Tax=Lacticaseibacillus parahuelsenbergensis TaxID=3068305 RepID=A0ABY9L0J6_9LACO|nr:fructose-6-phosphate aldolase [Lacticaseibacillus sp. NCIMB 15471]WLV76875.1 fructose-6-phosphate aldolase [Lacticaseibacillus sp. NCIMB 15471]